MRESKEKKALKAHLLPPSLSQLLGWPVTNNKGRAEEHLLPPSKEEDKGERSCRDPVFDLLILFSLYGNQAHGQHAQMF